MPDIPILYHYWCGVSAIAAMIGKRAWFQRGHIDVYPNFYTMLLGGPGVGKGVSIGIIQKILRSSGYKTFAANRSSKEKFLADFHDGFERDSQAAKLRKAQQLFHSLDDLLNDANPTEEKREVLIVAEEFNDFLGTNNAEFVMLLTEMWSHTGPYEYRLKNSPDSFIPEPCVNILAGNTPASFAAAFPANIMGTGFLARLICVHGEISTTKTSFPTPPDSEIGAKLAERLTQIRDQFRGQQRGTSEALFLLDEIHQKWDPLPDGRFQHYSSRRFTHLLKLCLVFCAARLGTEISMGDVRSANTLLSHTENLMSRAIGEFGKAKNSDTLTKIIEFIVNANKPVKLEEIFKHVATDVQDYTEVGKMLMHLSTQGKIMMAPKGLGYVPKAWLGKMNNSFIDAEFLKKLQR